MKNKKQETKTENKLVGTMIDQGTIEQKQLVKDELLKLCKVADAVNEAKAKKEA